MTRNRKLVMTAITLLVVSAVVAPQKRIAAAWAIVQCAQFVQRLLPVRAFSFPQLDPTCPQCL
jgi:hypothetical protein